MESPFTIVVDTREQSPFAFSGIRADVRQKCVPITVTTIRGGLKTGDYSIQGAEDRIAVERKSLCDLYGTLGQGRRRFVGCLTRLSSLEVAAVVIEADWETIIGHPPPHSRLLPKTVFRSVLTWQQRFPTVHWWACPSRAFAEVTTYRILERFWRDRIQPQEQGRQMATVRRKIEVPL